MRLFISLVYCTIQLSAQIGLPLGGIPASSSPISVLDTGTGGSSGQYATVTTTTLTGCATADAMAVLGSSDADATHLTITDSVGTLVYHVTTGYSGANSNLAPALAWFWATGTPGVAFTSSMTVSAQCPSGSCGSNGFDTGVTAICLSHTNASPLTAVNGASSFFGGTTIASGNVATLASNIVLTGSAEGMGGGICTGVPTGYTSNSSSSGSGQGITTAYKLSPANPENPSWTSCPNVSLVSTSISLHQ